MLPCLWCVILGHVVNRRMLTESTTKRAAMICTCTVHNNESHQRNPSYGGIQTLSRPFSVTRHYTNIAPDTPKIEIMPLHVGFKKVRYRGPEILHYLLDNLRRHYTTVGLMEDYSTSHDFVSMTMRMNISVRRFPACTWLCSFDVLSSFLASLLNVFSQIYSSSLS